MKTTSIYDSYRLPSKVFFTIFLLCATAWVSRVIRVTPTMIPGELMWLRAAEWPVWMEHVAASLGMPSPFLSVAYWAAARPNSQRLGKHTVFFAFFMPIFVGLFAVVLLVHGEVAHEMEQIMLVKPSNYGQFLADRCIPANTIHALSACSADYRATFQSQNIADLVGTLSFLILLVVSTWRLAVQHLKLGAIRFGTEL